MSLVGILWLAISAGMHAGWNLISILKGKDAGNGHDDYVFENLTINGVAVNEANKNAYFEMNEYARNIRFLA